LPNDLPSVERPCLNVRRDERSQGVVVTVTLNNPEKLNAMNVTLMEEFLSAMNGLAGDERLRAVVLTGAGDKAFTAGVDINDMAAIENAVRARAFITRLHRCCAAIRDLPAPVIARIQGYCFGGGLELAAACDARIASDIATFGMQEVKIGIPSVIEAALLPMLVGWGRAREIMYLGETFSAADAHAWGLVERVAPAADLDAEVESWIAKLLTSKAQAVREQKRLMRQWEELPLAAAVEAGVDSFAKTYETDAPVRAMRDFLAARAAHKKNR
jgi:enoyl-CoA hydratase